MSPRHNPIEETIHDPLPRLREQLAGEYEGMVPPETIDQVAERALEEFEGARIRDFVPVFAWRRARELLRRAS
jgi:hypothetical protein